MSKRQEPKNGRSMTEFADRDVNLNRTKMAPKVTFTPFLKNSIISSLLGTFLNAPEIVIWYLFLISVNFSSYSPKISIHLRFSLPFGLTFAFHLLKFISAYKTNSRISKKLKTLPVGVFIDDEFLGAEAKMIFEGDLVLFRQNFLVHCDCLILGVDSEVDNLYVKQMDCDDSDRIIRKKALKETNRLLIVDGLGIKELKKKIESVKVNYESLCSGDILGKIKIRESPAIILAKDENFLRAGSIITDCDWVLGLVVSTGQECKTWAGYSFSHSKFKSSFETKLRLLFVFSFILMGTFIMVSVLESKFKFGFFFSDQMTEAVIQTIILFSNLFPITLFLSLEIFEIINYKRLNWKNPRVLIKNPKSLEKLGLCEYIITESLGVFTDSTISIDSCSYLNLRYQGNIETLHQENFGSSKEIEINELKSTTRNKIENDVKSFENFQNLFKDSASTEEKLLFGMSLAICNKFISSNSTLCDNPLDTALLKFAFDLGFKICAKEKKKFIVEFELEQISYEVLISAEYKDKGKIFLIRKKESEKVYLVGKISSQTELASMLEEFEIENYYETRSSLKEKKVCKVFYLYKCMEPESVKLLLIEYKRAKSYKSKKSQMIYSALASYCTSMKLLSELKYSYNLNPGSTECIHSLKNSGAKIWMSSSSSSETLIALSYQLNLIPETSKTIELTNFKSPNKALKKIEKILSSHLLLKRKNSNENNPELDKKGENKRKSIQISHPLFFELGCENEKLIKIDKIEEPEEKIYVCIDSNTLSLSFSSRVLMERFLYILFAADTVIFCDMTPNCKKMIVKLIKESFHFKPAILTIGASDSAFKMIAEADVGVMISPDLQTNYYGDIVITELAELENLILKNGKTTYYTLSQIIQLTIFIEYCTIFVLFLYQTECSFSGTPIIDFDLLVIFELLLSLSFILSVSFQGRITNQDSISPLFLSLTNFHKSIFYQIFVGSVNGIFIYYIVTKSFKSISNSLGFTEDFEAMGIALYILLNLSLYIQALVQTSQVKKTLICILLNMILLSIILILSTNFILGEFLTSKESYTRTTIIWPLLCVLPLAIFMINFTLQLGFKNLLIFLTENRYDTYKNNMKKLIVSSISWQIQTANKILDFDKKNLKFKDPNLEKEFQIYINKTIKVHLSLYLIGVSIFLIIENILTEVGVQEVRVQNRYYFGTTSLCIFFTILSFFLDKKVRYLEIVFYIFIVIASVNKSINERIITSLPQYPIFTLIFCLDLNYDFHYSIIKGIILYAVSIFSAVYETYIFDNKDMPIHSSHWAIIMLINLILILVQSYAHGYHQRKEFLDIQSISIEVEKSSTILGYLLPSFVRNRVKNGARYIAEEKGIVSIVFCDIYNFDKILKMYTTKELTYLLNSVFEKIDLLCDTYGATKIETVGKTYLACTGLKDSETEMNKELKEINHARRAIDLALAIINDSKSFILHDGSKIQFKIGVNSGPVTAGVVGYHKPQFSLVGDTVNTASRMASTLKETDSVQISEETFNLLKNTSGLEFTNKQIEAKGKGIMNTKLVFLDINKDLNESNIDKRKSSFLSESPKIFDSIERTNDFSTNFEPKNHRKSLLNILELANATEIFRNETMKKINDNLKFSCRETDSEKKFRFEYFNEISIIQYIGIIASVLCNFLLIIAETTYLCLKLNHYSFGRLMIIVSGEVFMIGVLFLWKKHSNNLWFSTLLSTKYTLEMLGIFIIGLNTNINKEMAFMYFSYNFLLLNFFSGNLFCKNLLFNAVSITILIVQTFILDINYQYIAYALFLVLIVLYIVYAEEKQMRVNAVVKGLAENELNKTQELLSQMMPPQALSNLEMGIQVNDRVKLVTIMYADIVGFTAWSSIRTPNEVVGMLSELFTRFDQMCVEHSVYKVHTIGDCYVAMGYVNENNRNPAKEAVNMIDFALSLIEVIQETNDKCGISLGMRIGLHTGEIIGAITGTKVVRYDIYGTDVQIANKMESSGESGKVCVSEVTKSLVEDYMTDSYLFEFKEEIVIASSNLSLSTYFAENIR